MRGCLILTVLLTLPGLAPLHAAPLERGGPATVAPLSDEDAHRFAVELYQVSDAVARNYVRPIARSRLLLAALTGLYEEVQVRMPELAQAQLEEAMKATGPDIDKDAPQDQDNVAAPITGSPIVKLLLKYRQFLGDRESIRGQAGLRIALTGLTRALDPFSKVIDGNELRRGNGDESNHGVGIEVATEVIAGPLHIKQVIVGGPAQRAGIRPGDRISHINNKQVDGAHPDLVLLRDSLIGDENGGRKVDLTILPAGSKTPRTVTLTHTFFRPETVFGVIRETDDVWNCMLDARHKIGYIRLGPLDHGTSNDVQQALVRLKQDDFRGLILDLRWSPIGFVDEAVNIAETFLSAGVIATVNSRNKAVDEVYKVRSESPFGKFPMIVLVNAETSGGAEMVAAALHDNKRAKVAGQRSFGKASVQTMVPLPVDNAGMKLSTGNFIRPNGKTLNRFPDSKPTDDWGVQPDRGLGCPVSADLSQQLKDWYHLQALRPGRNNEALPLDDPENDPQRQAALAALIKMLK